jgi:hypothetical protein
MSRKEEGAKIDDKIIVLKRYEQEGRPAKMSTLTRPP